MTASQFYHDPLQKQPLYFIKISEKKLMSTKRYVHKLNLYLVLQYNTIQSLLAFPFNTGIAHIPITITIIKVLNII